MWPPKLLSSFFLSHIDSRNRFEVLSDLTSSENGSEPDFTIGSLLHSSSPARPSAKKSIPDHLKILNVNFQSLPSKKVPFLATLEEETPDIVVGTESWLTPAHRNGEYFPPDYQIFRKDRTSDPHGGIFVAIKNEFVATERKDLSSNTSELLWIELSVEDSKPTLIGVFYRPQSTDENYIENIRTSLENIPIQNNVWLLGDFNLPDVKWESNSFVPSGRYPALSKTMINIALDHNLQQLVTEPTRGKNTLDLFFTNNESLVQHVNVKPGVSDRDYVEIECLAKPKRTPPTARRRVLL